MDVKLSLGATAPSLLICPPSEAQAAYGLASLLDTFDEDRPRRNRRAFEENVIPLERRGRLKGGRGSLRGSLLEPVGGTTETALSGGSDEAPILVRLACSLMGPHHPDLVDLVHRALGDARANVEDSRMTVLGAEFAMLVLFTVESRRLPQLDADLADLCRRFSLERLMRETSRPAARQPGTRLHVELSGVDHEGIVRALTRHLGEEGLQVEDLEARVMPASGAQLPRVVVTLELQVPPGASLEEVEEGLHQVAASQHLEVDMRLAEPQPLPACAPVLSLV